MKKVLLSIVALLMLAIGGALLYVATIDLNSYKPQITQAVKDASGLELVIEGDIAPSLSPVGVSIQGVKVSNPSGFDKNPFFTLKRFDVAVELMPLFHKEVKVKYVELSDIDIVIIKSAKGTMNVETKAKPAAKPATPSGDGAKTQLPLVLVDKVLLSNVNITYNDLATKAKATINDVDIVVTNINFDAKKEGLKAVAFDGTLDVAEVVYDKYAISKIAGSFTLKEAVTTVGKLEYSIFKSRATGSAVIDLSGTVPKIALKEKIPALDLSVLAKTLAEKDLLEGTVDTTVDLSFAGQDAKAIQKTLTGTVGIVGKSVGVIGYDLDKVLGQYDKTQKMDAVDIGAFLVAGPVGTLLTKGGDVSGAFEGMKGGKTLLKDVVLKTDIAKGIAMLSDVALATSKNRLAIKGALDLPNERFNEVSVGVLDVQGCATYSQTITGTFTKPGIKVDEAAVSQVTNMVGSLFGKVKGIVGDTKKKECTSPFYKGSVVHPVK